MSEPPPRRPRHFVTETPQETARRLHVAMADSMRDYRNTFGITQARRDVLMQMYVLGIIGMEDSLVGVIGEFVASEQQKEEAT